MKTGSCHCKKIVFDVRGPLSNVNYCYCNSCRKLSGAAFSIVAKVSSDKFKILYGEQFLQTYESKPGKLRYYCRICCSPIFVRLESEPDYVRIRLGVLDFEPKVKVVGHIWVSEKPNWHDIDDSLPQYSAWPQDVEKY